MLNALLINPNTSGWVTDRLAQRLRQCWETAGEPARLDTVTARFGASYIASEVAFAVAAHATLDAWAVATTSPVLLSAIPAAGGAGGCPTVIATSGDRAARRDPADPARWQQAASQLFERPRPLDVAIIGCFGDPGLEALAALAPVPVVGLAEASISEASACGRFAIVTGGLAWKPILERIVRASGHGDRLTDVIVLEASGADLAGDPARAQALLGAACLRAVDEGAEAVVVGGAAFAGFGDRLADALGLPIIDCVSAAARVAAARVALRREDGDEGPVDSAEWSGVGIALADSLRAAPAAPVSRV